MTPVNINRPRFSPTPCYLVGPGSFSAWNLKTAKRLGSQVTLKLRSIIRRVKLIDVWHLGLTKYPSFVCKWRDMGSPCKWPFMAENKLGFSCIYFTPRSGVITNPISGYGAHLVPVVGCSPLQNPGKSKNAFIFVPPFFGWWTFSTNFAHHVWNHQPHKLGDPYQPGTVKQQKHHQKPPLPTLVSSTTPTKVDCFNCFSHEKKQKTGSLTFHGWNPGCFIGILISWFMK